MNSQVSTPTPLKLEVIAASAQPLIDASRTVAGQRGFGFEGGCVRLVGDTWHLFTAELVAEPLWSKTVLAHWSSEDGIDWRRRGALRESTGDFSGRDRRAAYFSPMPVFDPESDRWQLYYVSYRSAPGIADRNFDGIIWRAQSAVLGFEGIGGPYVDQDVALRPDDSSQEWEGHQGTDSFFAFCSGPRWIGLYGSCDVDKYPDCTWSVGVSTAASASGPWTRHPVGNPLDVEPRFIENPVVSELSDGSFLAVYENDALDPALARSFGVMVSDDGVVWSKQPPLFLPDGAATWATRIRTPLSFIPTGDGWAVYFTAFDDRGSIPGSTSYGNVGVMTVRVREG